MLANICKCPKFENHLSSFARDPDASPVRALQHAVGILNVARIISPLVPLHRESKPRQQLGDLLVRQLDAASVADAQVLVATRLAAGRIELRRLLGDGRQRPVVRLVRGGVVVVVLVLVLGARRVVLEVPEQRPHVDPDAAGTQAVARRLDVRDDVGRRVHEEYGCYRVVRLFGFWLPVRHAEVR